MDFLRRIALSRKLKEMSPLHRDLGRQDSLPGVLEQDPIPEDKRTLPLYKRSLPWNRLCAGCQDIFHPISGFRGPKPELISPGAFIFGCRPFVESDVQTAAENHCLICSHIAESLPQLKHIFQEPKNFFDSCWIVFQIPSNIETGLPRFLEPLPRSVAFISGKAQIGTPEEFQFQVNLIYKESSGLGVAYLKFLFEACLAEKIDHLSAPYEIADSTFSDVSLDVSKRWIHECETQHPNCRELAEPNILYPSRLIEIDTSDSKHQFRLRIRTQDFGTFPYATLSYCWGSADVFRLYSANLLTLQDNLPFENLPRTIRDAISITLRLGIRYLWVDSLCIIQDSIEDWERESSRMADVYRNGLVNIAATGVTHANEGTVYSRNPCYLQPCLGYVSLRGAISSFYHIFSTRTVDWVASAPLNTRGWVLQERLLAPRTLHFGPQQVFWECRTLCSNESWPGGIPGTMTPRILTNAKILKRDLFFPIKPTTAGGLTDPIAWDIHEMWRSIVALYSSCQLTRSSDKLIALSGLAQYIQRFIDDEYLAGLWRRYLLYDLLWHANPGGAIPNTRPAEYRAPSWSWASVDGDVAYRLSGQWDMIRNSTPVANIIEAPVETAGAKCTGKLEADLIKLSASLLSMTYEVTGNEISMYGQKNFYIHGKGISGFLYRDEIGDIGLKNALCLPLVARYIDGALASVIGLFSNSSSSPGEFKRSGVFDAHSGRLEVFRKAFKTQSTISLV